MHPTTQGLCTHMNNHVYQSSGPKNKEVKNVIVKKTYPNLWLTKQLGSHQSFWKNLKSLFIIIKLLALAYHQNGCEGDICIQFVDMNIQVRKEFASEKEVDAGMSHVFADANVSTSTSPTTKLH